MDNWGKMAYSEKDAERQNRRRTQWAKQDQLALDNAVQALVQQKDGRSHIYWLFTVANAWGADEIFTGNALTTAFNCGQQNVGKRIMAHVMDVAPDAFLATMKEKADERAERDREQAGPGDDGSDQDGGSDQN